MGMDRESKEGAAPRRNEGELSAILRREGRDFADYAHRNGSFLQRRWLAELSLGQEW